MKTKQKDCEHLYRDASDKRYCVDCGLRMPIDGENTCDKCGAVERSEDLVWITAEDFEPKVGEVVPKSAYKKYDALCEKCYKAVLTN